jgi:3-methylornithine--L-lysine ligase
VLCDMFLEFEFSPDCSVPLNCPEVDLILPAIENIDVLTAVQKWAEIKKIPLAFDLEAYLVSNSKLRSHDLFEKLHLPVPISWPACGFPVVVKPDQASGSRGVEVISDLNSFCIKFPDWQKMDNLIIQEYMEGPSYSIEVVGCPGDFKTLQVTCLGMDSSYDCNRIIAPTRLPLNHVREFEKMALAIAKEIKLKGIMDVEVILHKNRLKLLEIDARLPSQTPMTVYWSTGINMVKMLGEMLLLQDTKSAEKKQRQCVLLEHVKVSRSGIENLGEHIMAGNGPLTVQADFFGACEAITSFTPGKDHSQNNEWVATLIFTGKTRKAVAAQKQKCYEQIRVYSNLNPRE